MAGALPAEIADWFPFLSANELRVFGAVAVFRFQRAASLSATAAIPQWPALERVQQPCRASTPSGA